MELSLRRMEGTTYPISWAYWRRKITIRLIRRPPEDSSASGIRLYPNSISMDSRERREYTLLTSLK